jgi:hypothetical protein
MTVTLGHMLGGQDPAYRSSLARFFIPPQAMPGGAVSSWSTTIGQPTLWCRLSSAKSALISSGSMLPCQSLEIFKLTSNRSVFPSKKANARATRNFRFLPRAPPRMIRMKKALLVMLVLILAGAVGVYVVVVRPLVAPAAQTFAAEAALATPDLVLLAAVNVKQAVFLERWFLGAPVIRAADGRAPRPADERTMVEHLTAARVDVRRDVEHVVYGLYPATDRGVRHAVVIVGHFDAAAVERYLAGELHGVAQPVAGRTAYEVRRTDPDRCDDVTTWMISVDPRWILISDTAAHATLVPRLTQVPAADEAELAWWRALAHSDVLSVGMWRPRDADQTVSAPFLKTSARAMVAQAEGIEHLYLGLGARTVPPSGRLRVVLDAADAPRLRQKLEDWRQALQQSRDRWTQTAPSLGALFDSVRVTANGNRETIEFTVDRTLASNLERAINELLVAVVSGLGGRMDRSPRPAQRAERIDSQPVVFAPVVDPSRLAAYDATAMFAEEADQVQGPFGIRLAAMRIPSVADSGLELDVEAFAGAIPNAAAGGERARLFVDGVSSLAGQALLRVEPCGRQRNAVPGVFSASGGQRLRASKTVRLVPGADPHTLGAITGHVELRLPTRVETLSVARPAPGATLAAHGAKVTIIKVDGGDVQYQIAGVRDRVLEVRALNAAGQPLASEMKISSDFLLGEGTAAQTQYAGVVDKLEVAFVAEEQALRWPFKLTDLSMAGKPGGRMRDTTPDFRPYGVQALRRDVPRGAPFELSFDRAQSFFTTKLDFTLRSQPLPNFERAFTVGRLSVKRIELKDGTILAPSTAWDTAVRFGSPGKDGMLTKPLYVLVDAKPSPESIKAVDGVLTLYFPRTIRTMQLADLFPGQRAEGGGLSVTVTARGRRSLTLKTDRAGERVLYVKVSDPDGQPVMSFSPNVTESADGAWRFDLSPQGVAGHADVIVAGELERKDYPFRLEPK